MNRLIVLVLLATLAAAVLLAAGCGPTPTPTPPGESLEWEEIISIDSSSYYEETAPTMKIVVTPEQVSEFEGLLLSYHLELVRNTDFGAHFFIAVFQGEKMTTGYSVEVLDVRLDNNVITVYARLLTPPTPAPGQIVGVGPAITSPYCVLRVKKVPELKSNFTFVLVANGEEIMRKQHTIP